MKQELLRKWVEALESGEYEQAQSALSTKGRAYCCLGVLCEVSELGSWSDDVKSPFRSYSTDEESSDEFPPEPVLEAVELKWEEIRGYATMNDDDRASFREIAAEIRRRHPDVFTETVV